MKKAPKISRIELTPVYVPFQDYIIAAMKGSEGGIGMALQSEEEWVGGDFVICKLITEDNVVGLGEAFVWLPETGVTPSQLITVIEKELYKYILGESPFDVERMKDRMDNNVARSEVSKGLLDIACYDLMGKLTGQPACNFMGGRVSGTIPNAVVIPLIAPESMLAFCKEFHNRGFRTFRLKLGRNINDDVAIVSTIRKGLGDDVRIRVDYNQAYLPVDAVRAINAIAPYGIDCVEQPVKSTDFIGMAYVQKRVDVPLMAHEGAFSLQDMTTLLELGAIGVMGINSERPGGVTKALKAITLAESRGMGVVIHNQALGIAESMHAHLAASRANSLGHAVELVGQFLFVDDLVKTPIDYADGIIKVPEGDGWGVELDEAALEKYAVGKTVIIK